MRAENFSPALAYLHMSQLCSCASACGQHAARLLVASALQIKILPLSDLVDDVCMANTITRGHTTTMHINDLKTVLVRCNRLVGTTEIANACG